MSIRTIYLLLCLVLTTSGASFADEWLSVKTYGAKGDGVADDTEAIQKAINEAVTKYGYSLKAIPGQKGETPIYFGAAKTVFLPVGVYRISKPLVLPSLLRLISEKATLVPAPGFTRSVALKGAAWQTHIEGLQFVGFDQAINLNTNGVDVSKIVIADCDFLNNKMAIELYAQSALTVIRENRFYNNDKVLEILSGDKVDMHDNWITSGTLKGTHDAQIINKSGVLHFDRNLLVPIPPAGAVEPAWINNYNIVYIEGARQGAEPGSFTLVNNFAAAQTAYPTFPNGVSIRNSDCYAVYGNTSAYFQPAALRLINIPNNIVLDNLKGFVDAKVIDFSQQAAKRSAAMKATTLDPFFIKVDIKNVQGSHKKQNNGTDIPEELKQYLVP